MAKLKREELKALKDTMRRWVGIQRMLRKGHKILRVWVWDDRVAGHRYDRFVWDFNKRKSIFGREGKRCALCRFYYAMSSCYRCVYKGVFDVSCDTTVFADFEGNPSLKTVNVIVRKLEVILRRHERGKI